MNGKSCCLSLTFHYHTRLVKNWFFLLEVWITGNHITVPVLFSFTEENKMYFPHFLHVKCIISLKSIFFLLYCYVCYTVYFFMSFFETKNIILNIFSYCLAWQEKINFVCPSKLFHSRVGVVFPSLFKSNFKFILIL